MSLHFARMSCRAARRYAHAMLALAELVCGVSSYGMYTHVHALHFS